MSGVTTDHPHPFEIAPIAREIWDAKYRLYGVDGQPLDATVDETFRRVARAAAAVEAEDARQAWEDRFHAAMADFGFLPAGRILAGAGAGRQVTLFNCFVLGAIPDDLGGIFDAVKEAALTMQQGGGIGHDFSTLRPKGALVASIGAGASGPVSFMDVWDAMCRTIMSAGARRGAMMGTLRCDHPDIEAFIDAKRDAARLRNFNLSVLVTDAFVAAVKADGEWALNFAGRVYKRLPARALWDRLMRATYETAEPGVIFIDRINETSNLAWCETIHATNPCGEQPLPPYGACLLGSLNLARLVRRPLTPEAAIDEAALDARVAVAVRLLDNMIDISNYPLESQRAEAKAKRRIGLGVTGLADALALMGLGYGTPEGVARAEALMARITRAAYLASSRLAAEKGAFALCDAQQLLARPFIARLDADVRADIARHGLRNGCLTSIAPTGTISLLAGNVSSGIEPIFARDYTRNVLQPDGSRRPETVVDYALALARRTGLEQDGDAARASFVTAGELTPGQHLAMQAAIQRHVDSSISKTVNVPEATDFESFKSIYLDAYDQGLKGCTTYRPNAVTGAVLSATAALPTSSSPAAAPAQGEPIAGPFRVPSRESRRPDGVVYMAEPLARDEALAGYTYKLRWPGSEHAIYVTINDIERDGRRRPFEIFINTKSLEHSAWMVALTRMISAVFRRGGDVSFVVEELAAVYDPQGGQFIDGAYVPSIQAAIGAVIERHLVRIGFMAPRSVHALEGEPRAAVAAGRARGCPRCGERALVRVEGCWVCQSCGHSRCG
ncbi:MAG: adenosylcobalamin-dependent ribonucleoside-diphosphate reductase [Hyphomicrobiaceae bacterium]